MSSSGTDAIVPVFFGGIFSAMFSAFFLIWLLVIGLSLAATIFWVIEMIDACRREFPDQNTKLIWILVLIFSHGVGALVYFFVGRQQGWLPGQLPLPDVISQTGQE